MAICEFEACEFEAGDVIRMTSNCSNAVEGKKYRLYHENGSLYAGIAEGGGDNGCCSCQEYWKLISKKNNIMEEVKNVVGNIREFAKNLVLSADEKLLRKYGLKDGRGEYTSDAKEIIIEKLAEDNKDYLLAIVNAKETEETKK